MKNTSLLLSLFLMGFAPTVIVAEQLSALPRISGRVQYEKNPGEGSGSMKFIDSALPQAEVRVGPTREEGVALGFLMAFETTPAFRQHMAAGTAMELVLEVKGTSRAGAPDDLTVALLDIASSDDAGAFVHFGAWNNARDLTSVGTVDADPDAGVKRINVTAALRDSQRQPSAAEPVVWFAVYLPAEAIEGPEGRHVIFSGTPLLRLTP
jgi:hypothetical protein